MIRDITPPLNAIAAYRIGRLCFGMNHQTNPETGECKQKNIFLTKKKKLYHGFIPGFFPNKDLLKCHVGLVKILLHFVKLKHDVTAR